MQTQAMTNKIYSGQRQRLSLQGQRPGKRSDTFYRFCGSCFDDAGAVSTCSRQWCGFYDDDRYECFYDQHDSSLWCKYILSFIRHFRKGESAFEETGSYDDFCIDRRFLYTGLPDRIASRCGDAAVGNRMGVSYCGDDF